MDLLFNQQQMNFKSTVYSAIALDVVFGLNMDNMPLVYSDVDI